MTNQELVDKAASVINPHKEGDYVMGDVGCALISDNNNLYTGVCIDTLAGIGFCAEQCAIGAMVTAGEYKIKKIVGVWKDDKGKAHVLPPCGRCREFMKQINKDNLKTEIILKDKVVKLEELLPYHEWFE